MTQGIANSRDAGPPQRGRWHMLRYAALTLLTASALHAQTVPTTITLTVSNSTPAFTMPPGPGLQTPAASPVVLTATVIEMVTGNPVMGGTVTFYDNAGLVGPVATAVPIGTSTIQFSPTIATPGRAMLSFNFGPGSHGLTATYSGTSGAPAATPAVPAWASSTVASAVPIIVSGSAYSSLYFTLQGPLGDVGANPNQYPIYSGDEVFGFGLQFPNGTVTVTDQTTGATYASNPISSTAAPYSWGGGALNSTYAPVTGVTFFFLADPYRYGFPSEFLFSPAQNQIWLGSNFTTNGGPPNNLISGCQPCTVAATPVQGIAVDVNGDGLEDLIVAHNDTSGAGVSVGVLMNTLNVDPAYPNPQTIYGTETTYSIGHPVNYVAVGDLNGDGKPDIVAETADGSNLVTVLLNNGDGTFSQGRSFHVGVGAAQIALADFNGDGILDLAVLNATDSTVGILRGNGDGTFNTMVLNTVASTPVAFVVADLNADGLTDIGIIGNDPVNYGELSFLYGNGDGTFLYSYNPSLNNFAGSPLLLTSIQAGDLNGDGYPDLVIGLNDSPTFSANALIICFFNPAPQMYGNDGHGFDCRESVAGDQPYGANVRTVSVGLGDLNGDGVQDVLLMPTNNINLPTPSQNGYMAQLTGAFIANYTVPDVVAGPTGMHTFVAAYTPMPNSIYLPDSAGPITANIPPEPEPMLTPSSLDFGTVSDGSKSAALPVILKNIGSAVLNLGRLTPNTANFNVASTDCGATLAVGESCTFMVTFSPAQPLAYSDSIPVVSSYPGPAPSVALVGSGTDALLIAVTDSITTTDSVPLGTSSPLNILDNITTTDSVPLNTSNPLIIMDSITTTDSVPLNTPNPLSIMDSITTTDSVPLGTSNPLNIVDAITITDSLAATVPLTTVTTLVSSTPTTGAGANFTLTATVATIPGSPTPTGTIVFSYLSATLGTIILSGGVANLTLSYPSQANLVILAKYQGDSNYLSNNSNTVTVVTTAQSTLTVTSGNATRDFDTANVIPSYTITGFVNGDNSTVVTGTPLLLATSKLNSSAGSYPIIASQGSLTAPSNYSFAFVNGTETVLGKAPQVITFIKIPNVPLASVSVLTMTAHSTSGAQITYAVTGPATIFGSKVTLTGTGTVTVTASQPGNSTFVPATSVVQSFQVY